MRAAVVNVYVGNRQLDELRARLLRTRCAVIAASEAQRLGKLPGYHRHGAPGHADRFTRETAIYTRHGVRVDAVTWSTATVDVGGNAHARTVVEVRLRHGGRRWAPIVVHANPGRAGRPAAENVKLMQHVAELGRRAMADGYHPVPMGDFNRRANETGPDTPTWLATRLGGRVHLAGVDGVVTSAAVRVVAFKRRARPPGSDHPLVVVKLGQLAAATAATRAASGTRT